MDPKRSQSKAKTSRSSSSSGGSEDGSPASASTANLFANDGSFMEMFKKKMEAEMKKKSEEGSGTEHGQSSQDKKPAVTSFVGKRRGGVFLKTGMVAKKQKPDTEVVPGKSDAWSKYMAEVKKYKAHQCSDDDKTRPLVK